MRAGHWGLLGMVLGVQTAYSTFFIELLELWQLTPRPETFN